MDPGSPRDLGDLGKLRGPRQTTRETYRDLYCCDGGGDAFASLLLLYFSP
jgi:hypothetical protein